jgi:hypothetical protein
LWIQWARHVPFNLLAVDKKRCFEPAKRTVASRGELCCCSAGLGLACHPIRTTLGCFGPSFRGFPEALDLLRGGSTAGRCTAQVHCFSPRPHHCRKRLYVPGRILSVGEVVWMLGYRRWLDGKELLIDSHCPLESRVAKWYICGCLDLWIEHHHNSSHNYTSNFTVPSPHTPPPPPIPTKHIISITMSAIEQTWSLEGKVAVVTGSGKHINTSKCMDSH